MIVKLLNAAAAAATRQIRQLWLACALKRITTSVANIINNLRS